MTKDQYKDLLIKRIIEEKKILKELMEKFNDGDKGITPIMNNQYGYVAGLEHALRLLGE